MSKQEPLFWRKKVQDHNDEEGEERLLGEVHPVAANAFLEALWSPDAVAKAIPASAEGLGWSLEDEALVRQTLAEAHAMKKPSEPVDPENFFEYWHGGMEVEHAENGLTHLTAWHLLLLSRHDLSASEALAYAQWLVQSQQGEELTLIPLDLAQVPDHHRDYPDALYVFRVRATTWVGGLYQGDPEGLFGYSDARRFPLEKMDQIWWAQRASEKSA